MSDDNGIDDGEDTPWVNSISDAPSIVVDGIGAFMGGKTMVKVCLSESLMDFEAASTRRFVANLVMARGAAKTFARQLTRALEELDVAEDAGDGDE